MSDPSGTYRLVRDSIIALVVIVFFVGVVALIIWPGLVQEAQVLIATDTPVPSATLRVRSTVPARGRVDWTRAERAAFDVVRSLEFENAIGITYTGICPQSVGGSLQENVPEGHICVVMAYFEFGSGTTDVELVAVSGVVLELASTVARESPEMVGKFVHLIEVALIPEYWKGERVPEEIAGRWGVIRVNRVPIAVEPPGFQLANTPPGVMAEPWMLGDS